MKIIIVYHKNFLEVKKMKKTLLLFIIAVFAAIAVACGSDSGKDEKTEPATTEEKSSGDAQKEESKNEEVTVKHQLGETKVKKNPEKVIVFDFGTLDSLDKLGVEVLGIPKKNIPSYLSKFEDDKYENIGGLKEPDFEKINELQPDLIIISGRQSDSYDEFTKIAPTIYMGVDATNYMESFQENVNTLAEIFEKEDAAKEELAKIDDAVKELNDKASASDKKALVILANDGKVSAYGSQSRFGIIHDVFGLKQADENIEATTHGQSISFEYIVEKDPDYLFVIDRGAVVGGESSAKQVVENELVSNTKAVKEGNVIYLDPGYWYLSGGGLESVSAMIKEVSDGFQ